MSRIRFGDVLYIKGRIGWQLLRKDEYLKEGDYYLVTGVDITDTHRINFNQCYFVSKERYETDEKIQLKVGDIIVTKDGTIGKIGIIDKLDKPATLNSHLFLIRNERPDILDTGYLFQVLRSAAFQKYASNNTSGSNIPAFTQANIANFEIDLPSIKVQQKVAKALYDIDEKIINNININSQLESLAKTIYDYWFLQFEFPNEEGKPYKSSGGKMVWNDELKREIPEGWEVNTIASLISEDKGGDWGNEELKGNYSENVYCIRGADFPASLGKGTIEAPERWILPKNAGKKLNAGDILIEISGGSPTQSTGRICYINEIYLRRFSKPVITSNFCKAISLKNAKDYVWFYETWQSLYDNDVFFNFEGKTTGLKNLLFDVATESLKITIPNREILDKYAAKCNLLFETIQSNLIQNQELASLRDFLLPMLMNGQVTFKEEA